MRTVALLLSTKLVLLLLPHTLQLDIFLAVIGKEAHRTSSRKRSASPPSPTYAQWRKVPCMEARVYKQRSVDSSDLHTPVVVFNTCTAVRIAHEEVVWFSVLSIEPLSTQGVDEMSSQPTNVEVGSDCYKGATIWFWSYISEYRKDKDKLFENIKSLSNCLVAVEEAQEAHKNRIKLNDAAVMKKVLEAIDLLHLQQHIVDTRPWSPTATSSTSSSTSSSAPATSRPANSTARSFVCKFISETVRDTVSARSKKRASVDSHKLFGSRAHLRVFLRPPWLKQFYILWRKTCEAAVKLHYMR